MDGQRFDDLTRALAAGTSRRRALKLLGAALGGALAGRRATTAVSAQDCRRLGRRCDDARPCCANLACLEGVCVPAVVEQVAACVPPLGACGAGQTCCPGASCAGGVCCPVTLACGDVCCSNGTICLNGVCATPGGAFVCPAGQRLCGAAGCRDLATDANNCGSCGRVCASGVCAGGQCGTPLGSPCTAPGQCASGVCADGVCCNTACAGQCESCATGTCLPVTGLPVGRPACAGTGVCAGTCDGANRAACAYPGAATTCADATCSGGVVTSAGICDGAGGCAAGAPASCDPYVACNAAGTACATSCAGDGDCVGAAYCDASNRCVGDGTTGAVCTSPSQCASGFCADGYCCDTACTGQCEACDRSGARGTCSAVTGTPVGGRATCGGSGACAGTCNGTNRTACAFPGADSVCRAATCANGEATPAAGCDGRGFCPDVPTTPCDPYQCGGTACLTSCGDDEDCVAGAYCADDGRCQSKQAPGATCTAAAECASGFCVDGVCCNGACTGQCEGCNIPGAAGTCTQVVGPPVNRTACDGTGDCVGSCAAGNTATCTYPGGTTTCAEPTCADGTATAAGVCNGSGGCTPGQSSTCDPYVCDAAGTACATSCASSDDCVDTAFCDASDRCVGDQDNGGACTSAGQCASGFCVDGVCCEDACAAPANATATCPGGACGYTCAAGYGDCNGDAADGCETNTSNDLANCGACDNRCTTTVANATATCADGRCGFACNAGFVLDTDGASCDVRTRSVPPGGACDENIDCESGTCCGRRCCAANRVCEGTVEAGVCDVLPGSVDLLGTCDEDADCARGVCRSAQCCLGNATACQFGFECCSGVCTAGTCAVTCANTVLSGGPDPTTPLAVDDDVYVQVNGVTLFNDNNESANDSIGPIGLGATTNGDRLRVVASSTNNFFICGEEDSDGFPVADSVYLSPLYLHCLDAGRRVSQTLDGDGSPRYSVSGCGVEFYNATFTVRL